MLCVLSTGNAHSRRLIVQCVMKRRRCTSFEVESNRQAGCSLARHARCVRIFAQTLQAAHVRLVCVVAGDVWYLGAASSSAAARPGDFQSPTGPRGLAAAGLQAEAALTRRQAGHGCDLVVLCGMPQEGNRGRDRQVVATDQTSVFGERELLSC